VNGRRHHRGTVLVVTLGLLAALAIIGATMISVARIDRFAAQGFRQSAELDMAVDGSLTWVENELTNQYWSQIYWAKLDGTMSDGVVDMPAAAGGKTHIAVARPDEQGRLAASAHNMPGLAKTSGGGATGTWYNLPLRANLPVPGKSDTTGTMVPDGWVVPALTYRTTRNRTIEVALTIVDLCARYNVNFHGDAIHDASNGGQSFDDEGYYVSDIAPNYVATSYDAGVRPAIGDSTLQYRQVVAGGYGRWQTPAGPASGNADLTMNFFNPHKDASNRDKPFLADDMMEILDLRGTERETRLEKIMPRTFGRNGQTATGGGPADPMFYKSLFTCYSWVSAARPRISNDSRDRVVPRVDLDSCTKDEIRKAFLACGFKNDGTERKLMDQVLVNVLDYRDTNCRPTALKGTYGSGGTYTVYGVDRQPFITEYYIRKDSEDDTTITYTVFVELANPYKKRTVNGINDEGLKLNESYTRLTVGKGTTVSAISLPAAIAPAPDDKPATIEVLSRVIQVPKSATQPMDYLEPVLLFAQTEGDETKEIVIDRLTLKTATGGYETITAGQSWQRLNRSGVDRAGNAKTFFAGWTSKYEKRNQTCDGVGPDQLLNPTNPQKLVRIIENRSLTKDAWVSETNRERGLHKGEELSFPRVGDLCRVLRVGPTVGTATDYSDYKPITQIMEELGTTDASDVKGYVSPMGAEGASASREEKLLQRLFSVVMPNNPYFDGVDNDGDFDDKNANNVMDANEAVFDENDTGFQEDSGKNPIDSMGPELYLHGRINLRTAPPEVIRGMLPMQLARREKGPWDVADCIARLSYNYTHPGVLLRKQVHSEYWNGNQIFTKTGSYFAPQPDKWDDDDNGAPDDFAEQCYLYTFMSNFATVQSDCYAVYGTASIKTDGGRVEGVRRFVAVLDRVPATAYPPMRFSGPDDPDLSNATDAQLENATSYPKAPNPRFIPVRRVMQAWIE